MTFYFREEKVDLTKYYFGEFNFHNKNQLSQSFWINIKKNNNVKCLEFYNWLFTNSGLIRAKKLT